MDVVHVRAGRETSPAPTTVLVRGRAGRCWDNAPARNPAGRRSAAGTGRTHACETWAAAEAKTHSRPSRELPRRTALDHRGAWRAELLCVDAQHEEVVCVPGAGFGPLLRMDARQGGEPLGEVPAIGVAHLGLTFQPIELHVKQRPLQFAEPVVSGNRMMLVPHAGRNAAAVLDRAASGGESRHRSWSECPLRRS